MELSQNFGACNPFLFLLNFSSDGNQQFETKKNTSRVDPQVYSLLPHLVRQLDTDGRCGSHGSVKCKQTRDSSKDGWLGKEKTNETHDGCMKNQRYHKVETFIQTVCFLHNGWSVCWKLMLIFLWLVVSQAAQATMAQYLPKVGKDAGVWVDERMSAFLLCLSFFFLVRSLKQP